MHKSYCHRCHKIIPIKIWDYNLDQATTCPYCKWVGFYTKSEIIADMRKKCNKEAIRAIEKVLNI